MHDEQAAQFDLSQSFGLIPQQVQHVKLAGAEVPAREKNPAGIPQGIRRAQQQQQGLVTGRSVVRLAVHGIELQLDC